MHGFLHLAHLEGAHTGQVRGGGSRWRSCAPLYSPGKTGLMISVYKALLPRVQADLHQGAWVYMLEFASVAEDPHQRFGPVAERADPAGVLVLDEPLRLCVAETRWQQESGRRRGDCGPWSAGIACAAFTDFFLNAGSLLLGKWQAYSLSCGHFFRASPLQHHHSHIILLFPRIAGKRCKRIE